MRVLQFATVGLGLGVTVMLAAAAELPVSKTPESYAHPLVDNTTLYPSQKVRDSRYAAVIAMDAYLRSLKESITMGTPLPMKALTDDDGFARKGDDLWEVTFRAQSTRKVIRVMIVNARTGGYKEISYSEASKAAPTKQ